MDSLERRRFAMFARVRDFAAQRTADFPADSLGAELILTITTLVNELAEADGDKFLKKSGLRQRLNLKSVRRESLREDLLAISRTARAMAVRVPAVADKFRMPKQPNDVELLATARAFASDAEPFQAEFRRFEMAADFLERLRTDIAGFEEASRDGNVASETSTLSHAAIDEAVERGLAAVAQLDAVMRNKYRDDATTLGLWARASHVERPVRAAAATAGTGATPAEN